MRQFSEADIRRIAREVLRGERALRNRRPRDLRRGSTGGGGGSGRVRGLLVGAMATTAATHTIDNVTAISGASPLVDPTSTSETLTVDNSDFDMAGDDDAKAYAEYHPATDDWHFYQVEC